MAAVFAISDIERGFGGPRADMGGPRPADLGCRR